MPSLTHLCLRRCSTTNQEVGTKRIWLLEGSNWGEHANLQRRWADNIASSKGHTTTINTIRLYVSEIKVTEWPAIMEIMPAGLQLLLSEKAYRPSVDDCS